MSTRSVAPGPPPGRPAPASCPPKAFAPRAVVAAPSRPIASSPCGAPASWEVLGPHICRQPVGSNFVFASRITSSAACRYRSSAARTRVAASRSANSRTRSSRTSCRLRSSANSHACAGTVAAALLPASMSAIRRSIRSAFKSPLHRGAFARGAPLVGVASPRHRRTFARSGRQVAARTWLRSVCASRRSTVARAAVRERDGSGRPKYAKCRRGVEARRTASIQWLVF